MANKGIKKSKNPFRITQVLERGGGDGSGVVYYPTFNGKEFSPNPTPDIGVALKRMKGLAVDPRTADKTFKLNGAKR